METVTFRCGHCNNLMGVSQEHIGQQVRCPHCQQVVVAPALPPPPAPAPAPVEAPPSSFSVPGRDEQESIFSPPQEAGDDIFGQPPAPKLEIPPSTPAWLQPSPEVPGTPAPVLLPSATPLPEPAAGDVLAVVGPSAPVGEDGASFSVTAEEAAPLPLDRPDGEPEQSLPHAPGAAAAAATRSGQGSPWTVPLGVALLSYCVLSTIASVWLYTRLNNQPHPLEVLPDVQGDGTGARRKSTTLRYKVPDPEKIQLPARLRVSLGETISVGDLEVSPVKVKKQHIKIRTKGSVEEATPPSECLALELHLRNRSEDISFKPMDRFFTRKPMGNEVKPFTALVMGSDRFYGGPIEFSERVEVVDGQDYDKELKPGEEMTTFVCTNPDNPAVLDKLARYQGPIMWRVQVRRGLVKWRTLKGKEREDSATAVVGVEFKASDIH